VLAPGKNQERAMSAKTHSETTLLQPSRDFLRRLSITVAFGIILTVGSVILKAFNFVNSSRSGGSEW
jgi:hypothetical protein